jgi:predicted PurR-regulated permease PerM
VAGRSIILAASFVIVVAGMKVSAPILVPFLLSVFIAVIVAPPFFWLKGKKVPDMLAVLLVVFAVVALGLFIAAMVGSSVDDFQRQLPFYQERLSQETVGLINWAKSHGIEVPRQRFLEAFNPGVAMKMAAGMLSGLGGVLTNAFLILLTVVFILLEASSFPAKLKASASDPDATMQGFGKFLGTVQKYMAIKTWVSLATGGAIAIWLSIIGVDYPLLWGLLAFLFNYVPNIGSIIAAVPAVLLGFVQLGGGHAALTAMGFLLANVVMGNVVEPRVMGKGLGLSTLVVFLSLVFWGWVLGLVGMLLAVPLTMTVKIALESSRDTRHIAVLLGPATEEIKEEVPETEGQDV